MTFIAPVCTRISSFLFDVMWRF